jgi:hypothetical protein
VVARDGTGRKVARSVTSCAECLAWGLTYCQGVCLACYNFAARYRGQAGGCAACGRRLPLRDGYCRLCWCQARYDRAAEAADARSAVVLAPWLERVRHHQLFLRRDGQQARRASGAAPPPRRERAPAQAAASHGRPARRRRRPAGPVRFRAGPGLPPALERLRIDCQLAEALATGFDPLHLAEIFGFSEHTAIRYAVNARQLTAPAHQGATPSSPAAPGPTREDRRAAPASWR